MRRLPAAVAFVGVALLLSAAGPADAGSPRGAPIPAVHPEAPPAAHTGGFGEPSCLACHSEYAANLSGGALTVEGLPEAWEPGRRYTLSIVLTSEGMGAAGFQMALRHRDGAPAGELESVSPRVAVTVRTEGDTAGVFAHHTRLGSEVDDPDRTVWEVMWQAPRERGPGDVVLHAAANSGNGDNSPFGDLIYLHEARLSEAPVGGARARRSR